MKATKKRNWINLKHFENLELKSIAVNACLSITLLASSTLAQVASPPNGLKILAPQKSVTGSATLPTLRPLVTPVGNNNSTSLAWTTSDLKEFSGLMNVVSSDLASFFQKNPDIIADYLGGNAYNAWGSVQKTIDGILKSPKKTLEFTKDFWLWFLFRNGSQPKPIVGVDADLCKSPRVCQSMQYLVGNSILNHWSPSATSGLAFYPATINDGAHSFIVVLPAGIPATAENVRIQGFIIDPFYSQSSEPSKFLRVGSNKAYSDLEVGRYKITREDLEGMFGKNPLNVENTEPSGTNPTPPTNSNPTPPTVPVPAPNPIFCDTNPYARNPDGTMIYFTDPQTGNPVPVTPADMYAVAMVLRLPDGTIQMAQTLSSVVKCDWEKNSSLYLNSSMQYLLRAPSRGERYNCLATYVIPAGTPYVQGMEFTYTIESCL